MVLPQVIVPVENNPLSNGYGLWVMSQSFQNGKKQNPSQSNIIKHHVKTHKVLTHCPFLLLPVPAFHAGRAPCLAPLRKASWGLKAMAGDGKQRSFSSPKKKLFLEFPKKSLGVHLGVPFSTFAEVFLSKATS